jgi:1-deoxy-D-xylulose-5-phosphate reductoisomerase
VTKTSSKKRVVVLGATGSIGRNALRVIAAHRDKLELVGIASACNAEALAGIARDFAVRDAALGDEAACARAREKDLFPAGTRLRSGAGGLVELAQLPEADLVLVAVVGTAGLQPALAALAAKKDLALASKEILVLAGKFVMAAARAAGTRLLPVDSEHSAVFQCLAGHHPGANGASARAPVSRVTLTASGGAFRDLPADALAHVTPADALKHPNWSMGPKITVDSATLANKGLELIEAQWLFGLQPAQLHAVLHPQSIVHCVVEFADGAMLAQLAPPSMTFPIQHALLFPERAPGVDPPVNLQKIFSLDFRPVDEVRNPCLRLARETMAAGGVAPAIYNAANEVAVAAFLDGRASFLAIPQIIEQTLSRIANFEPTDLAAVLAVDADARRAAANFLSSSS